MGESVTVTLRDEDEVRNFENALSCVEEELDAEVSRSRGRPGEGQITMADAVTEMAAAYAGIDLTEDIDG